MGKGGARNVGKNTSHGVNESTVGPREDYYHSYSDEPHVTRRKLILEKHPEIKKLFGNDIRVVPFVVAMVFTQLYMAWICVDFSWPVYFFVAWAVGGTITHSLSLMTHECSHNLVFATRAYNDYFGMFCNVAMCIPSSTTFKRYHIEHHQFQGYEEYDMDIPTEFEGNFFTTPLRKLLFLVLQAFFYGLRPSLVRPKTPSRLDITNLCVVLVANYLIYTHFPGGYKALVYMLLSDVLGMGLHPCAGHFISEHYVFNEDANLYPGGTSTKSIFGIPMMNSSANSTESKNPVIPVAETYSYYGSLNILCWNVGYHNEHHDFPRVPGWRLPEVTRIAPEFYEHLPQHKSWTWVLVSFILNPSVTPYSRVIRNREDMIKQKDILEKQKIGTNTTGNDKMD